MLTPVKTKNWNARESAFAIVASRYNARYVDGMLVAAVRELKRARAGMIKVVRVPGAYEIPVAAARLLQGRAWGAILCLGVVIRGETVHAQQIGDAVSASLAQLQIEHLVPVIHEVLLLENEAQARARCLGKTHNRGAEAAQTALAMARVMASLE
ncbi:MAG: 6,7-dimethyl-8-ribityllumazine synthase [Verrucomicrobiota bacterium]|jgi:6,7-dimethyl-8-ribityllumazine synthase